MIKNIKFGECLNSLLSTLDISINRLSKSINVDSSLVNRWINGKRIPSYNTSHIETISEYLSKNIQNSFQMQHLDELFSIVCKETAIEVSIKDKIKKVLSESQGYSIECKRMEKNKDIIHSNDHISKLLNNYQIEVMDNNKGENHTYDTYNIIPSINLSNEDTIIIGTKNVMSAVVSLLEAAGNKKCRNNNTIYISFNYDVFFASNSHTELIYISGVILKAINNGWNILYLLRLDSDINRAVRFVNFVQPIIKTGRFMLYYYKNYSNLSMGKEIIVIPEIGSLLGLSTKPHQVIDCAFYFKNKVAIDIFMNYFKVLLVNFAQPLIKYYTLDNTDEYGYYLVENAENIGNQIIYKPGFSNLTLPINLYKKLLIRKKLSRDEMLKELELYRRRLNAFLLNIHNYKYKDIYLSDSINNLIKYRKFQFYSHLGIEIMDLEPQDIIELLQNIINLLETYDNYNIAFMHQSPDNSICCFNHYSLVKERQSVIFEAYKPLHCTPEVRLSIEEPMLVKAFEEYYKEIWERIAPVNKDKKEIIAWIQSQVNLLKDNS